MKKKLVKPVKSYKQFDSCKIKLYDGEQAGNGCNNTSACTGGGNNCTNKQVC